MQITNEWTELAKNISFRKQMFINGEYVNALSGKTFDAISPIDQSILTAISAAQSEDVDLAVKSAKQAFDSGIWRDMNPRDKKEIMLRWADLVRANYKELALLETLEVGKPIGDTSGYDALAVARNIQWYAETIDKTYDEIAPAPKSALAMITREPLGVIGAIVPWNYPNVIASWKFAPAIAMGNSIVLKPSEESSLATLRIAELAVEAGLPNGVFNVVTGLGHEAGKALAQHLDVAKIAFTGSTVVGRMMLQYAADSNMKQVSLELGGKSAQVVLNDVVDLDAAASTIAWGIFYNSGQTCNAGSRVIVQAEIKDALFAKLNEFVNTFRCGHPLDPQTQMGPVVSLKQRDRVNSYLDQVGASGERFVFGGKKPAGNDCNFEPTLIDGVAHDSKLAQEEIFGPVIVAEIAKDEAHALELANGTNYGLAASVWSGNITKAHNFARKLRAGTVWINTFDMSDVITPFGGFKNSGSGRDKSLHALDAYSALKTTWVDLN
jgi:acyl-CoA reductase-like NAD-dependent aldehyde dehydrogenase